jgi:hypothetical protein
VSALNHIKGYIFRSTNPFGEDTRANLHALLWDYPCKAVCHGGMETECFLDLRIAKSAEKTKCVRSEGPYTGLKEWQFSRFRIADDLR